MEPGPNRCAHVIEPDDAKQAYIEYNRCMGQLTGKYGPGWAQLHYDIQSAWIAVAGHMHDLYCNGDD